MTTTLSPPEARPLTEREESRDKAKRLAIAAAAMAALVGTLRPGIGLAIAVACFVVVVAQVVGIRTRAGVWCATWLLAVPWLVVRDNRWLAICIVATAVLMSAFALAARSSRQSLGDFSLVRLARRVGAAPPRVAQQAAFTLDRRFFAVVRGLLLAAPVVWIFATLLGSGDAVFASLISVDVELDLSTIPAARFAWFLGLSTLGIVMLGAGADTYHSPEPTVPRRVGELESSIVLGSVCALFSLFIALRVASFGREFSGALLRDEVRGGFFQLLWVAALTVMLVLLLRRDAGGALTGKVRLLAVVAIMLAAVIDGLALVRIAGYVRGSFATPLRFWSFGFGLWLLVVLLLAGLRAWGIRPERRWFTVALVTSWMVFVLAMAAVNPDDRIATYNFDNAPTEPDRFIAITPLIGLSADASETIVENIEVFRPLPNNRFNRLVEPLCESRTDDSWRQWHWGRSRATGPLNVLCQQENFGPAS